MGAGEGRPTPSSGRNVESRAEMVGSRKALQEAVVRSKEAEEGVYGMTTTEAVRAPGWTPPPLPPLPPSSGHCRVSRSLSHLLASRCISRAESPRGFRVDSG